MRAPSRGTDEGGRAEHHRRVRAASTFLLAQGTQHTSIKLTTRLVRAGIQASMGSVGDSFDNALAENLWMLIKTECIRGRVFATRAEANRALFEYIDGLYNPRRIQKRLGYLSPIEFEEKHYANQAAAEQVNLKPRQPSLTS
ncbi:transposase [Streptomyces sp. NPDC004721]